MADWMFAATNAKEEFSQLHFFSLKVPQDGRSIDFRITVREFSKPNQLNMLFYAEADPPTNQKIAPYIPSGWGPTLLVALSECIKNIHRFPYQGD